jgi:hypothetical protein
MARNKTRLCYVEAAGEQYATFVDRGNATRGSVVIVELYDKG